MRKKVLLRRKQRLEDRRSKLLERSEKSTDVNEVRTISEQLEQIAEDLKDIADELAAIEEDEPTGTGSENGDGDGGGDGEERANLPTPSGTAFINAQIRGSYGMNAQTGAGTRHTNVLETMEYRQAFANFVRTGDRSGFENIQTREGEVMTTETVGMLVPKTIMDEFIRELKSYGQLYELVRKLNLPGGVEFPVEELVPTVTWLEETAVSDGQARPEIKKKVQFSYYTCEARITQSLLSSIVTLEALETEIAKILAEAFVKEFDNVIVNGTGTGQPTGIVNDKTVKAANKVAFTDVDMADWTTWRKKLFAKVPLAYRGEGILVMTAGTWESEIMTLKDANGRPLYRETYDVASGTEVLTFNGKRVVLVEPDIVKDFDAAAKNEAFAIYFKPTNYVFNTNLQVGFKRYFNEDTNKWVNKGLCICDGKLIDPNGVFILIKGDAS